ncbi:hypothetical protein [Actinomadura spongiicola]|nr:hypothetical protein [Actinomadura spongiicola]
MAPDGPRDTGRPVDPAGRGDEVDVAAVLRPRPVPLEPDQGAPRFVGVV